MNTTDFQKRLEAFLLREGISKKKFEIQIGVANGFAGRLNSNSRKETFEKIAVAFPDLNIAWLRTGVGSMLNSEAASSSIIGGDYSANALGAGASASVSDVVTLRSVSVLENQLKEKDEQISRLLSLLEKISIH